MKFRAKRPFRRVRRPIPGWFVLLVVVMTAGATAWAMSQTAQGRGWTADPKTPYLPRQATNVMAPAAAAVQQGAVPVAARGAPPTILAGAVPRHEDRGACTGCHVVVTSSGTAVPAISARAVAPHEVRGVCTNCHVIAPASAPVVGQATLPPAPPQAAVPSPPPVGQPVGGPGAAATCPMQF